MSNDNDEVRVSHRISKELRDLAQENSDHGEMSEIVRNAYEEIAYGESADLSRDELTEQLRERRAKVDKLEIEKRRSNQEYQAKIDEQKQAIVRLEERLSGAQSRSDKFEGELDQLVAAVDDGKRVFVGHGGVRRAAETIDETQEYVLRKIRERRPDAPDELFEENDIPGGR